MAEAVTRAGAVVLVLLMLAWSILIAVAIFRSAAAYKQRYPQRRAWGYIAQGMAILGLLGSFGNLGQALPGNELEAVLDAAVAQTNKGAPRMVGQNVRLDRVSREGPCSPAPRLNHRWAVTCPYSGEGRGIACKNGSCRLRPA